MTSLTKTEQAELKAIVCAPAPGERGYQLSCGCCAGPEDDRCVCWIHQDTPRGRPPHKCSLHCAAA